MNPKLLAVIRREYLQQVRTKGFWIATGRGAPAASARRKYSDTPHGVSLEMPMWRTLPWRTSSYRASSVSAIGVAARS